MKKYEDAKGWLLGLRKYFRIHDYYGNVNYNIATYNLKGKEYIWWEDLKNVIGIIEKELTGIEFEKILRN